MKPSEPAWIWLEHPFEMRECYARFRRTFDLAAIPSGAKLRITADSRYRLYVNGRFAGYGPARSYPHRMVVDEIEVSGFLQKGANILAVMVYQPGYSHFGYVHRAAAGLWLTLRLRREGEISTDRQWKASRDASFAERVRRISIYGAGQEIRSMSSDGDWTAIEFDDSNWSSARIQGCFGQAPWTDFEARAIPASTQQSDQMEFIEAYMAPAGTFQVTDDPHRFVIERYRHRRPHDFDGQGETPFVLGAQSLLLCHGLPHSRMGSAEVRIENARGGEWVMLTYFEKGQRGKWMLSDPDDYGQLRMTDAYQLAEGTNRLTSFTPRGGRYVMVTLAGDLVDGLSVSAEFRTRQYRLEFKSRADVGDDRLAEILAMCERTVQACTDDVTVNCPWREQAAWLGDGVIIGRIIAERCGDPRLLRRTLELAIDGQYPDGLVPGVVPSEAHSQLVLEYNFAWIEGVAAYAAIAADRRWTKGCWPVARDILNRFAEDRDDAGLIHSQPGRRWLLDWADLPREEPSALYNMRYLYAMQLGRRLATIARDAQAVEQIDSWISGTSTAIRKTFHRDGNWFDCEDGTSRSQHLVTFLVLTELVEGEEASALLDEAVARSLNRRAANSMVLASPYMHYYLFEALAKHYREQDIREIVVRRWGKWLEAGSPTTWENWQVDFPDGSECHARSAHPLLFV